jgi:hypothetical protein
MRQGSGSTASVFSVPPRKTLNTEVTEILRDLCVEALKGRRTRRNSLWLRPPARAVYS